MPAAPVEASAIRHRTPALRGPTPLLRLQGDERLVALTRRGHPVAYEVLVGRYEARLLAFCRHMLGSREDAEDVLQEVLTAAFSAMVADDRPINVRPWLYRIARNRSLNHLRRQTAIGVDSMDVHLADHGTTTADRVHEREDLRLLLGDVGRLAETQRTALLLREIDALSYEQIAEAMDTTVPAVKSLLVRARVGLAEAAEARDRPCEAVRVELAEAAEGLARRSAVARRHVRGCERCRAFDQHLRRTTKAVAAVAPVGGVLLLLRELVGQGASALAATASATSAAAASAGSSALGAGVAAGATKAAATVAAAALVTAGAVEAGGARDRAHHHAPAVASQPAAAPVAPPAPSGAPAPAATRAAPAPPQVVATLPQRSSAEARASARRAERALAAGDRRGPAAHERRAATTSTAHAVPAPAARTPAPAPAVAPPPAPPAPAPTPAPVAVAVAVDPAAAQPPVVDVTAIATTTPVATEPAAVAATTAPTTAATPPAASDVPATTDPMVGEPTAPAEHLPAPEPQAEPAPAG